ncbi:hypothetical protein [Microbacterium enclense]|uniref:hypothetical protein n=1 Tax=Microbacterium enclense TaxID=993073 RepID=UPI003F80302E
MHTLIWTFDEDLDESAVEQVVDQLTYSSEKLVGVRRTGPREIGVDLTTTAARPEVSEVIAALVSDARSGRVPKRKVLQRTEPPTATEASVPLRDSPWSLAVLSRALDSQFRAFGIDLGAKDQAYPPVLSIAAMERCDYVNLFPQNVCLLADLPHDRAVVERGRREGRMTELGRVSEYLLPPAMCFHVLNAFADTTVSRDTVVTLSGPCFRHEAKWRVGPHRLPAFTMRENVALGDSDFVEEVRQAHIERVWRFFTELGLHGRIETATDPFYFPADSSYKKFQLLSAMKYELVVELRDGSSFSVASFNNMRDTMLRQFGIQIDGVGNPFSGCTAFGIERWAHAIRSEHGDDERNWPVALRGPSSTDMPTTT